VLQKLRIVGSIVLVVLISSRAALAVTVPLSFSGPEQTFAATVDLTTNLFATLDGTVLNPVSKVGEAFSTTPPLEHGATSLGGPYPFTGTPLSDDSRSPTMEIVGGHLTNISNLYLDLLAGDIVPLVSETVTVTTTSKVALLKNLTVDASIEVTDLAFQQSAPHRGGTGQQRARQRRLLASAPRRTARPGDQGASGRARSHRAIAHPTEKAFVAWASSPCGCRKYGQDGRATVCFGPRGA